MKIIFAMTIVMFVALSPVVAMESGDQGYGVLLGNPSALTGKYWIDDRLAIDGAIGAERGHFDVHASFLVHDEELSRKLGWVTPSARFPIYIGVGPRISFQDKAELGIRVPLGVACFPSNTDWEFFVEVAPVLRLSPNAGFNSDFGIGARYYFHPVRPRR